MCRPGRRCDGTRTISQAEKNQRIAASMRAFAATREMPRDGQGRYITIRQAITDATGARTTFSFARTPAE